MARLQNWLVSVLLACSFGTIVMVPTIITADADLCKNPTMTQVLEDYHEDIVKSLNNCKYIFDGIIQEVQTLNGSNLELYAKAEELTDFNSKLNGLNSKSHDYCKEVELFEILLNILSAFMSSIKNPTSQDLTYKLLLEKYISQRLDSVFVDKFTGYWIYFNKAADSLSPLLSVQEQTELENTKLWFTKLNMMKKLAAYKYFYDICDKI